MKIDCHLHVKGGDVYRTENTGDEIIPVLDKAGIDMGVVFGMCDTTERCTQLAYDAVQMFPERLIGFTYSAPSLDGKVENWDAVINPLIDAVENKNMRGIKVHRGTTLLTTDVIGPVVEFASSYKIPLLIDSGADEEALMNLMKKYPDALIIWAHLGNPRGYVISIDRILDFLKDYENAYVDTAYLPTYWKIKDAVRVLGKEKVCFGSDGILLDPRTEICKIDVLDFDEETRDHIFYKNIAKILNLKV